MRNKNITPEESEKLFLVFCEENDRERALKTAIVLVDDYKANKQYEKILELNNKFIRTFDDSLKSTPSFLLLKEAINAAIQMIENISDNSMTDETAEIICATMIFLPMCYQDVDFMFSAIEKITACYASDFQTKLNIIACFLPEIEKNFTLIYEGFEKLVGAGDLDSNMLISLMEVIDGYFTMLFCENYPELVEGTPYSLILDEGKIEETHEMIIEIETLAAELLNLTDD